MTYRDLIGRMVVSRPTGSGWQKREEVEACGAQARSISFRGAEAHVETIAEQAEVGVGTLYRHFPTKQILCEAVLLERHSALTSEARQFD